MIILGHITRSEDWNLLVYPAIATGDEHYLGRLVRRKYEPLNVHLQSFDGYADAMRAMGAKPFVAQYQQAPYADGEGNGKCGYHAPLRKGIPWKVGDPAPTPWLGRVT